ncbi:MAG: LysM peptidoglycan-binding domain-containing protein [Gammaproteobacteria bacterium]|nr:LysM peptidoglycan-binding domain-containing protein [Gammaproteobacteria bacterium]
MAQLAATVALGTLLAACVPQTVNESPPPSPESAAALAIQLEPGPPPPVLISPETLWRAAKRLELKRERERRAGLQLDTTVPEFPDAWDRIRAGLRLPVTLHPRTRREIEWFQRHQDYIDRMAERARFYLPHIVRQIENRGMPLDLALLPIVESAFQPFAYSPAGAAGIWQFIPSTGKLYGLKQNWWYDGRRDIVESTRAALDYLEKLNRDFGGDWLLAVAAYNWGEGNVKRAVERNRRQGKPTDFWSLRVPRETYAYVPRLLALSAILADPEKFQLSFPQIEDDPYFSVVEIDSQIDLAHAAALADITLEELYLLNPGFNRWATDPDGPHRLLLPQDRVAKFKTDLANLPVDQRIAYTRHDIKKGESLLAIANRYRTSVESLKTINGLSGTVIHEGDSLMVPVASRTYEDYKLSNDIKRALARVNRLSGDGVKTRYRVRRGDSLWSIARRHNVRVRDLARWNNISARKVIRPGQRLVIWKSKPYAAARAASVNGTVSEYVVRRGDTLSGIAERHRTTAASLASLNGIRIHGVLHPGQRLKIPGAVKVAATSATEADSTRKIEYTVRAGDSLWRIARRFRVSVKDLQKWNELVDGATLQPGQTLRVFVAASTLEPSEG